MKYATLLVLLVLVSCNGRKNLATPVTKPLTEAVYASGNVMAREKYQVFAQVDGYLSVKLVNDGDVVKKGDVLFIIESGQQSARLQIARENFELIRKNNGPESPVIQELETAIVAAQTKMQFDSINFIRYENLLQQNATPRATYDSYKLMYENSKREYELKLSRLDHTRSQLHAEFENAKSQLKIAGDENERYAVRSEIDGMVFLTSKEQGELIRRGESLGTIGSHKDFYIQLSIDELDIQRIQKDQLVFAKVDAYPDKVFEAVIAKVYPQVNLQQQSLRADANFKTPFPATYSGLALEANIIIRQKNDALVIPKTAVLAGDSVRIKTDAGEKKIKVVTGIQTLDEIEIVDGLAPQQELFIHQ